jgi:hypothetical protein
MLLLASLLLLAFLQSLASLLMLGTSVVCEQKHNRNIGFSDDFATAGTDNCV